MSTPSSRIFPDGRIDSTRLAGPQSREFPAPLRSSTNTSSFEIVIFLRSLSFLALQDPDPIHFIFRRIQREHQYISKRKCRQSCYPSLGCQHDKRPDEFQTYRSARARSPWPSCLLHLLQCSTDLSCRSGGRFTGLVPSLTISYFFQKRRPDEKTSKEKRDWRSVFRVPPDTCSS